MQNITLNLNHNNNMYSVGAVLSNFNTDDDINLNIIYNTGSFIVNDVYLVICSFINEAKAKGHTVTVSFPNIERCETLDYASRIDFFKHIGIDYVEQFNRHDSFGNFIEIENLNPQCFNVAGMFNQVFLNNFGLNEEEVFYIGFLIDELACNMSMHSKSASGAYFYCQKFKARNQMEITIADSGIGIGRSLSEAIPDQTNRFYLEECIKFGVTSKGKGHGLYFTSEFIRRNLGQMILISGCNMLKIENGTQNIYQIPDWKGVILKLIINFDVITPLTDIIAEKYNTHA